MRVVSTVDAWERVARLENPGARELAWLDDYEAQHKSVFDVYYHAWGHRDRVTEAALAAPRLVASVRAAEARAIQLLDRIETKFREEGLLDHDTELPVVLMVGQHSSNGWVAKHEGRTTLFVALEFFSPPPHDELLLMHELVHVVQARFSASVERVGVAASVLTLIEGVAVAVTRALVPGMSPSSYLWCDDAHDDWVEECIAREGEIARFLQAHLDEPEDKPPVNVLFSTASAYAPMPARAGYWVGDQIASGLLDNGVNLRELVAMDEAECRSYVQARAREHR
jgi:hypothetical protein